MVGTDFFSLRGSTFQSRIIFATGLIIVFLSPLLRWSLDSLCMAVYLVFKKNNMIFNDEGISCRHASFQIQNIYNSWTKVEEVDIIDSPSLAWFSKKVSSSRSGASLIWSPPPNFYKFNFDGSKISNEFRYVFL